MSHRRPRRASQRRTEPSECRVEHHPEPGPVVVVDTLVVKPHSRLLDLYLSQLALQGASGWVSLVVAETGEVVAHRRIGPRGQP